MTLMMLQYPAVIIAFLLCALSAVLTGFLKGWNSLFFLLSGLFAVVTVILALVYSVPTTEILLLLVILSLIGCLCAQKEVRK